MSLIIDINIACALDDTLARKTLEAGVVKFLATPPRTGAGKDWLCTRRTLLNLRALVATIQFDCNEVQSRTNAA